jgi:serine/threonine protein kinase
MSQQIRTTSGNLRGSGSAPQASSALTEKDITNAQKLLNELPYKILRRFAHHPENRCDPSYYVRDQRLLSNGAYAQVFEAFPLTASLLTTEPFTPPQPTLIYRKITKVTPGQEPQFEFHCWNEIYKNSDTRLAQHLPGVNDVYLKDGNKLVLIMKKYPTNLSLEITELHKAYKQAKTDTEILSIEKRLSYISWTLCQSLRAFHEVTKSVHKDLKPDNIVLDESLNAKVIDFGIAVPNGTQSVPGGSASYMAPETWATHYSCPNQDIWGLAAVLFNIFDPMLDIARRLRQEKYKNQIVVNIALSSFAPGQEPSTIQLMLGEMSMPQHLPASDIPDPLYQFIFSIGRHQASERPTIDTVINNLEALISKRFQKSNFTEFLSEARDFAPISHFTVATSIPQKTIKYMPCSYTPFYGSAKPISSTPPPNPIPPLPAILPFSSFPCFFPSPSCLSPTTPSVQTVSQPGAQIDPASSATASLKPAPSTATTTTSSSMPPPVQRLPAQSSSRTPFPTCYPTLTPVTPAVSSLPSLYGSCQVPSSSPHTTTTPTPTSPINPSAPINPAASPMPSFTEYGKQNRRIEELGSQLLQSQQDAKKREAEVARLTERLKPLELSEQKISQLEQELSKITIGKEQLIAQLREKDTQIQAMQGKFSLIAEQSERSLTIGAQQFSKSEETRKQLEVRVGEKNAEIAQLQSRGSQEALQQEKTKPKDEKEVELAELKEMLVAMQRSLQAISSRREDEASRGLPPTSTTTTPSETKPTGFISGLFSWRRK